MSEPEYHHPSGIGVSNALAEPRYCVVCHEPWPCPTFLARSQRGAAPEPRVMPRDVLREAWRDGWNAAILWVEREPMSDKRVRAQVCPECGGTVLAPESLIGHIRDAHPDRILPSGEWIDAALDRLRAVPSESDAGLSFAEEFAGARAAHNAEGAARPTPSRKAADALLDAVEQAVQSEALPANIHARLRDAFNEVVDQANKTTLAKHGLVFEDSDAGVERCICDYDRPSRVKVGCPVHYPDPGADAEGETA